MKKIFVLFITVLSPIAVYCQGKITVEKEKAAIIAAIEQETIAYGNADYESWKAAYVQNDPFVRINSSKTGFGGRNNWQSYDSTWYAYYKDNPKPLTGKYKNEDYIIRLVTPEVAWAVYKENFFDDKDTKLGWNLQTRFLEKQNGKWKISYVGMVSASTYEDKTVESSKLARPTP